MIIHLVRSCTFSIKKLSILFKQFIRETHLYSLKGKNVWHNRHDYKYAVVAYSSLLVGKTLVEQ